jgi:hypothetical protein
MDVSAECAVYSCRVHAELIGQKKNVNSIGKLQGLYTVKVKVKVKVNFNPEQATKAKRGVDL